MTQTPPDFPQPAAAPAPTTLSPLEGDAFDAQGHIAPQWVRDQVAPNGTSPAIDDSQGDVFDFLKSGRVKIGWLGNDNTRREAIVRRLTIGEFEHFMSVVGEIAETAYTQGDDDIVSPKIRDAADAGDQAAITIRGIKRSLRTVRQNKQLAAEVLRLTDHPEYARDVDNLPSWLGGANYMASLIQHWSAAPLPSGSRPDLQLVPVPDQS